MGGNQGDICWLGWRGCPGYRCLCVLGDWGRPSPHYGVLMGRYTGLPDRGLMGAINQPWPSIQHTHRLPHFTPVLEATLFSQDVAPSSQRGRTHLLLSYQQIYHCNGPGYFHVIIYHAVGSIKGAKNLNRSSTILCINPSIL